MTKRESRPEAAARPKQLLRDAQFSHGVARKLIRGPAQNIANLLKLLQAAIGSGKNLRQLASSSRSRKITTATGSGPRGDSHATTTQSATPDCARTICSKSSGWIFIPECGDDHIAFAPEKTIARMKFIGPRSPVCSQSSVRGSKWPCAMYLQPASAHAEEFRRLRQRELRVRRAACQCCRAWDAWGGRAWPARWSP